MGRMPAVWWAHGDPKKGPQVGQKGEPEMAPNGAKIAQNDAKNESQKGFKQEPKLVPGKLQTLMFPCVLTQKGGPKGPPTGLQKCIKNGH